MADSAIVASSVSSWNYNFNAYMTSNSLTASTEAQWYTHLNTYLASSSGSQFRRHVVFSDDTIDGSTSNPIAIARITANHPDYEHSSDKVKAMRSFRDTVDLYATSLTGSIGAPFGYAYNYLTYEGYAVIELECYRNVGLAMACIMLVVVILIPDPVVSLLVFLSIAATIVEVCGFLHFWGLTIDSVTVILLVVSVGIAVDYAAHVGQAFVHYPGTAVERAQRAMTEMGTCVWHGFFSTFLAIIVLAPSKSYVFTTFFKELFMASTCGIFNGLLILPIFLKLFGRDSHSAVHRQSQHTPAVEMKASTDPNIGLSHMLHLT